MAISPSAHHETVDCTVLIVTYNSARRITRVLDSLPAAAGHLRLECVVVDNGSTDATVAIVQARPDVVLVQTGRNLGYAGAINVAAWCRPARRCWSSTPTSDSRRTRWCIFTRRCRTAPLVWPSQCCATKTARVTIACAGTPPGARIRGCPARQPVRPPSWLADRYRVRRFPYENSRDVAWAAGAALLVSSECDSRVGGMGRSGSSCIPRRQTSSRGCGAPDIACATSQPRSPGMKAVGPARRPPSLRSWRLTGSATTRSTTAGPRAHCSGRPWP